MHKIVGTARTVPAEYATGVRCEEGWFRSAVRRPAAPERIAGDFHVLPSRHRGPEQLKSVACRGLDLGPRLARLLGDPPVWMVHRDRVQHHERLRMPHYHLSPEGGAGRRSGTLCSRRWASSSSTSRQLVSRPTLKPSAAKSWQHSPPTRAVAGPLDHRDTCRWTGCDRGYILIRRPTVGDGSSP